MKTAGLAAALQPEAETARDLTVSKHGSLPKNSVSAGMVHEALPTQSAEILAAAPLRSQLGSALSPVAQSPLGVPKLANLMALIVPPPAAAHDRWTLPFSAALPHSPPSGPPQV